MLRQTAYMLNDPLAPPFDPPLYVPRYGFVARNQARKHQVPRGRQQSSFCNVSSGWRNTSSPRSRSAFRPCGHRANLHTVDRGWFALRLASDRQLVVPANGGT